MHDVALNAKEATLRQQLSEASIQVEGCLDFAALLYEQERFQESLAVLRRAVTLPLGDVSRAILLTALGWYVHEITGATSEPQALAEAAIGLTSETHTREASLAMARAQALLAECMESAGLNHAREIAASAAAVFDRELESGPLPSLFRRSEILLLAARMNALIGRFDEAARRCREGLATADDASSRFSCLVELGVAYREGGRLIDARAVLSSAVEMPEALTVSRIRVYYELSLTEKELGKTAEARAKIRKALDLSSENPHVPHCHVGDFWRVHGYLSYDLDDFAAAAASFQRAAEHYAANDPFRWSTLLWLGRCRCDLGELELAQQAAEQVSQSEWASASDREDAIELLREVSLMRT